MQHEAAQRGEDSEYQRVETVPWQRSQSSRMGVTQAIVGINLIVFIAMALAVGVSLYGDPAWNALTVRMGANVGPYTVSGQWWRLLTCIFIHGGLLHFAFNMWCLWDLGRLAESLYGHWSFGILYLICGLAASLASVTWNPVVSSVGASGAIFGIAGALIASFYLGEFSLPRYAIAATMRSVVVFVGYNLFFGAVIARTDNAAHIGGLLMGLLLGALIARGAPSREDIGRRLAVLLVGAALVAGGILWLQRSRAYLVHAQNGAQFLNEGKTDAAIAELEKSVSLRPDFSAGHATLSRAYVRQQDYVRAAAEMQRVVELNPKNEDARYRLGLMYLELKNPQKAQEVFSGLIQLNPNSADGHSGLGAAFSDQRRNVEALEEYKKTAAIDPDYRAVYYNMGITEARIGLLDDAMATLQKQRQYGDDADNEKALADVYQAKGMLKEAAEARAKAEQLSPGK